MPQFPVNVGAMAEYEQWLYLTRTANMDSGENCFPSAVRAFDLVRAIRNKDGRPDFENEVVTNGSCPSK